MTTESAPWWKSAVVYQVYPRSFADSDGDGIGDLRGIRSHLDHLRDLGIDALWISPFYRSPQDDNGYDISDYRDVDPMFGTLGDLDELIAAADERGIRIVLDLVVNHTSDEHAWFEASRARRGGKDDWYIWRDARDGHEPGTPGAEPNNWRSFFGGPAWEWDAGRGQYYLHLFSRKQPDLNWENPDVRAAVHDMMSWWLDRGIGGFRMDVINLISKVPGLPDGEVGEDGLGNGAPFAMGGPRLEEFLVEMHDRVFAGRDEVYLTVGEMPGATPEQGSRFTDLASGPLSMVFQFEHVDLDHVGGKWRHQPVRAIDLKRSFGRWQEALAEHGWNSLYFENHDQPRVVSRWGDDGEHWRASATAFATVLHLMRGTPYVYQGEEIGMTSYPFASRADLRDIESLNHFDAAVARGEDPNAVLAAIRHIGRDNARTPMQWDASPHAGFTEGEPWIPVNPNHTWLNVAAQADDPGSVLAYYRRLIALRHSDPVVVDGTFRMLLPEHPDVFAYAREGDGGRVVVIANLSGERYEVDVPEVDGSGLVLANVSVDGRTDRRLDLGPWEARVYRAGR
ncbi:alpha-glucosidase [Microbacter sp. GSS18]|nr:alpha-glucosidase [Microbacter sp. GSS18]